jgi:pimeloyl-ACP methyl ester carboxylesterase
MDRPVTLANFAGDVVGLLDFLGVDQADMFGFSLGSLVATEAALTQPAREGRLVLASGHIRSDGYHPAEPVAEVAELDARDVLDEPQEVRAGWDHRATDAVPRQAVQLPQQCVAGSLEIPVEIRLR